MSETAELIKQYCSAIDNRVIILLGVVALLWIIEPKIKQLLDKVEWDNVFMDEMFNPEALKTIYKWIGIGLLFIAGLVIYIR